MQACTPKARDSRFEFGFHKFLASRFFSDIHMRVCSFVYICVCRRLEHMCWHCFACQIAGVCVSCRRHALICVLHKLYIMLCGSAFIYIWNGCPIRQWVYLPIGTLRSVTTTTQHVVVVVVVVLNWEYVMHHNKRWSLSKSGWLIFMTFWWVRTISTSHKLNACVRSHSRANMGDMTCVCVCVCEPIRGVSF